MASHPLTGVRLVDFGWAVAGAVPGQLLADMGAEVIKVESRTRLDGLRLGRAVPGVTDTEERQRGFHASNRGKLSITVDLKNPKGPGLIKELAKRSDVVLDNFTPRVMRGLGLHYDVLRWVKPDIISVSMSCAGQYGPVKDVMAYAPVMSSLAGLEGLNQYHDDATPYLSTQGIADNNAGIHAVLGALVALHYRRRTGRGQFVDLSEWEAVTALLGEPILEYSMNRRRPKPLGNRHPSMAPHGIYPCKGEDRWVSIAVKTEEEWQSLRTAMGSPEWSSGPEFRGRYQRLHHQDELDKLVASWTRGYTPEEVTQLLQKAGVAAMTVASTRDLAEDPHWRQRGLYQPVEHPRTGSETLHTFPWRLERTPGGIRRHAPILGEHNHYIFGEVLGFPQEEIAALEREGAIA